jgi:hypothetical protein
MPWYIAGSPPADKIDKVFLDDVEMQNVREAHTEEGWVVTYIVRPLVYGERDYPTETRYGKIRVTFLEEQP